MARQESAATNHRLREISVSCDGWHGMAWDALAKQCDCESKFAESRNIAEFSKFSYRRGHDGSAG
jgi:hypothetical protein